VAELLLEAGAQVDARNDERQTPSDVAELNRETSMVVMLDARQMGKKVITGDKDIYV
jgi:ankyrin repeat protein